MERSVTDVWRFAHNARLRSRLWASGLLLLMGAGVSAAAAPAQEVSLPRGTPAPPAQLQDLEGRSVQLLDYVEKGKFTVVEFWASWCENCEALAPQFQELRSRWPDQVTVVAVAVGVGQNLRRVQRHVEEHRPGYPFLWDFRGEAVRAYHATTTSIVVILDRDGKVAYTGVGRGQDLVGAVGRLLHPG